MKKIKKNKVASKLYTETTVILTREEAELLFVNFLTDGSSDAYLTILLLLREGFKGIEKMSNKQLVKEIQDWNLLEDLTCDSVLVKIGRHGT